MAGRCHDIETPILLSGAAQAAKRMGSHANKYGKMEQFEEQQLIVYLNAMVTAYEKLVIGE